MGYKEVKRVEITCDCHGYEWSFVDHGPWIRTPGGYVLFLSCLHNLTAVQFVENFEERGDQYWMHWEYDENDRDNTAELKHKWREIEWADAVVGRPFVRHLDDRGALGTANRRNARG